MMLEWKVVTGDEKLASRIADIHENFEPWFRACWEHRCTREKMLSPDSPLPHIYHLMCLPFDEVKKLHPKWCVELCSDCGKETELWIETEFSFCGEYGCGITLCPECAKKLKQAIENMESAVED